jgi:hypothetical protein
MYYVYSQPRPRPQGILPSKVGENGSEIGWSHNTQNFGTG